MTGSLPSPPGTGTARWRLDDAALRRLARVDGDAGLGDSDASETSENSDTSKSSKPPDASKTPETSDGPLRAAKRGRRNSRRSAWAALRSGEALETPLRALAARRGWLGLAVAGAVALGVGQVLVGHQSLRTETVAVPSQKSGWMGASQARVGGSLPSARGSVPRGEELPVRDSQRSWMAGGAAAASVRRLAGLTAGVAALGAAAAAHGTDRLVPQQYATIQAAVNASSNGDRVIVSPGLYRESVRFLGKSIMLEGPSREQTAQVVISGVGVAGPAVFVADSVGYVGTVGLRNLTITSEGVQESGQDAGAIFSYLGPNAQILVDHCIFRDVRSGTGVGALYLGHSSCLVKDCAFMRNSSTVHGQAIYAYDNVQAVVENSVFIDHTLGTGTFYSRVGANILVRNCVVRNSNVLNAHFQTGTVTFQDNTGCSIGALSNGGYVDGGGNNWNGPCPDCDGNGVIDLQEVLFEGADCNGNGTVDACDLAANPPLDSNNDGVLDACQCIPDITGNGVVDGIDLAAVLGAWGAAGKGEFDADVTGDGQVDGADLAVVLSGWGPCPD